MDNKINQIMEDFLLKAQQTLTTIERQAEAARKLTETSTKAAKFTQWLFAIILVIMLGFLVDTKVEVVKKVDASEVEKNYMTKKNTLTVIKLSDEKNKDLIIRSSRGDTVLETSSYEWIRDAICDENYRGIN